MIGEPELDGAWEAAGPPEEVRTPERTGGGRAPRGPWWWALGGAVLASAVWGGALAVQDRFGGSPQNAYRQAENLCEEAPLRALGSLTGGFEPGMPRHREGPALDWSFCVYGTDWTEGRISYEAQLLVERHKRTDPGPEFGAGPGLDSDMLVAGEPEPVPGLGRRARFDGRVGSPRLQVLDGGTVFTLTVRWFGGDEETEADEAALKAAAVEDLRAVMAALKR
ncbi:hypothetical protein [Streptomyces subrutilus]|uniref:hypothetical protein n=1 Tax=Streptomyces subrutilus TaxID=36818 RepID=UPI002E148046|nr:hypothetical protein OG479_22365 [Streptomyces subrutilus]